MSYVHWLRFAPDGRRLVYYWGNIFLLDLDTQEVTQLTQGGRVGTPDWHPDGQHILYFGEPRAESPADSGSIRVLDLATGDSHGLRLANGRVVYGGGARWDPSGASFVYTRYDRRTRGSEVFRVWPEPSTEKRLTRRGWTCEFPKWFRNGAEVIFQINPNEIPAPNTADWWVVGASGSEPRPFLNPNVQIKLGYTFDFSPDWSQVVVCRPANCGTYWALWIIRFNETEILEERQITGLPGQLP
jgi:dipeptidyl aminopeptidase/acylaminoacyl peptidase